MFFRASTLLLCFLAASATVLPEERLARFPRCNSRGPSEANKAASQHLVEKARNDPEVKLSAQKATMSLDVYMHVICNGRSESDGDIPDEDLMRQLSVINDNYAPTGISFNLADDITHTVRPEWMYSSMGSDEEREMKSSLRKGGYGDINIWFSKLEQGTLGWCEFPEPEPTEDHMVRDGCVISKTTLPGGQEPYNLGKTLTHELGHWFNLYHTFQGGCDGGDDVDDTHPERAPNYGCPKPIDSCEGDEYPPGVDPVHNYMDYTDDGCMHEFTPGQITRMFQSFEKFRADK